jgi:hypothetical protein
MCSVIRSHFILWRMCQNGEQVWFAMLHNLRSPLRHERVRCHYQRCLWPIVLLWRSAVNQVGDHHDSFCAFVSDKGFPVDGSWEGEHTSKTHLVSADASPWLNGVALSATHESGACLMVSHCDPENSSCFTYRAIGEAAAVKSFH